MHSESTTRAASQRSLHLVSLTLFTAAVLAWLVPVAFASDFAYPNLQLFAWQLVLTYPLLMGGLFANFAAEGRLAGHGSTQQQACDDPANRSKQHAAALATSVAASKPTRAAPAYCGVMSCHSS